MQYRKLGNTPFDVSVLGMGCVTFGREIDEATSVEILNHALDQGMTLFDTAESYGGGASEELVGSWMESRGCRDEIVLASKVSGILTRNRIISSAEESLRRLKTDRIDLFQLHVWDDETPLTEMLAALDALVRDGKVLEIGCSNYTKDQLETARKLSDEGGLTKMKTVQPPYNLVQREIEIDLLPYCQEEGIGVISYSPLAAGFLTGKYRPGKSPPKGSRFDVIPGHQPIYFTNHGYDVLEQLDHRVMETGHTHAELAMQWTLQQSGITSVLVGARTTDHVDLAVNLLSK